MFPFFAHRSDDATFYAICHHTSGTIEYFEWCHCLSFIRNWPVIADEDRRPANPIQR